MKKFLILLLILFISKSVLALTVVPARLEVSQKRGSEEQYQFTIKNTREDVVLIKISIKGFNITPEGKIILEERKHTPNWLELPIREARIDSGALKTIFFTIRLSSACRGEKRAMFYFEETAERKGAVGVVMNFGSAVYCTVKGTEVIKAKIDNFKISTDEVSLLFLNLGNIHLRPEIKLKIIQDNKLIDEYVLNRDFPILPYQELNIEKKLENVLDIGDYLAILEIRYGEIFEIKEIPFGILEVE